MARWRPTGRELAMLLAVVVAGMLVGVLAYVVVDAARARDQAVRHAEAQARIAIDARQAQTDRITALLADVAALEDQVAGHEATIAAQSQAIADLSEQVRRAGEDPITGDPAPPPPSGERRSSPPGTELRAPAADPQRPQSTSAPPEPDPEPSPAPGPDPDEAVLCPPLDLLCIG